MFTIRTKTLIYFYTRCVKNVTYAFMCVSHRQLSCCKCINSYTLFLKFLKHFGKNFIVTRLFIFYSLDDILSVHEPCTSLGGCYSINIFMNLHPNLCIEIKSHLSHWFGGTFLYFRFESIPVNSIFHTWENQTPNSFMFFENLIDRFIIQINTKIDKNDTFMCFHIFLNNVRFIIWVIVYVYNLIIETTSKTLHVNLENAV